ncbi:hypothetical protein D9M70_433820 [compost metagenome]
MAVILVDAVDVPGLAIHEEGTLAVERHEETLLHAVGAHSLDHAPNPAQLGVGDTLDI